MLIWIFILGFLKALTNKAALLIESDQNGLFWRAVTNVFCHLVWSTCWSKWFGKKWFNWGLVYNCQRLVWLFCALCCKTLIILAAFFDSPIEIAWVKCWSTCESSKIKVWSNPCLPWHFLFDSSCPLLPEETFRVTKYYTLRVSRWEQNIDFCLDTLSPAQSRAVSFSLT